MATEVDQICYGRSREELGDQDNSREISVSQMLDHGSISFGRFALESLSWEKRSVFTHNRYQEELEKFPGLVAQKKAYFEEYYKRIRAMKALRENKHTEPSSNRSDSSGISGQIREDERVISSKSDGDEMINSISPGAEKASAESARLDSPAKFLKDNKDGESPPPYSKHRQILDINSYHDEPIITSIMHCDFVRDEDKLEPHIGVEIQRIIGKDSHGNELQCIVGSDREKASIKAPLVINVETNSPVEPSKEDKMGKNSQNSKQFQLLDQNSCDHEPIAATDEDLKHGFIRRDNEEFSKKTEEYVSNDSSYSSSSPEGLEDKLMAEQKKANQAVEGFMGNAFSSEVMEHSFTAGDVVKSELKTKPVTVMLRPILRDSSSQKKNRTVDRILTSKHATIASHTSNKERHSKATTLHPFAFSAGKKAAASISASPIYNTKKLPSSSSLQLDLKKREKKLENRRQAMVTNGQAIQLKGASASNAIRPLKARSVNLPTSSKGYSNVGTNSNRITTNNEDGKRKLIEVANDETCLKKVRSLGKSAIFHVLSRNQNPGDIKMAPPSRIRDLSVNVKNLQLSDNSAGRRNPRPEKPEKPEKPRWR